MKKKILSIVVTVLMAFAMMPMTMGMAYAAGLGEGVLYVGGQDIVTAGGTVAGDNGQGTATLSYDGDGNPVLTLDNYKCESCTGDDYSPYWSVIHYKGSAQLTIQLKGANILKPADGSTVVNGILSYPKLVIKGEETGSLTTIGGASGVSSVGIFCANGIQIESGNITAEGSNGRSYSYGIQAGNITINGGAVTARGHDAPSDSYGLCCSNGVVIYGGELVASSGSGTNSSGIFGNTTIGGDITRVEVVSNDQAIYGTVKNYVPGQGWDNTEGTGNEEAIPINKDGTRLEYKKLVFEPVLNISITGNSDSVTYNGKEQSVSGYTVKFDFGDDEWTEKTPDGVSVALKEGYTAEIKRTNAGSYNMGLTAEYFDIDWGRYKQGEITVTDGVLTIGQAKLTITAKDQNFEYNGEMQGPGDKAYADPAEIAEVVTVKGLQGNDELTGIQVDGQGQEIGTYELMPSGALINDDADAIDNYDVTYVPGKLAIKGQKPEPQPTPTPTPAKISGTLLSKMTAKGKRSLVLKWNKIDGVDGYDVFFSRCNNSGKETSCKKVKTIKGNDTFKWTKSRLSKGKAYKAYVKAYVMKDGKKAYVKTSPTIHAYTSGGNKNYTNAKSVTVKNKKVSLKKGKTYKIKASVNKLDESKTLMPSWHAPKLRYVSSNKKVVTVSKTGKITVKGKGKCKVYVIAVNGVRKAVSFTVK